MPSVYAPRQPYTPRRAGVLPLRSALHSEGRGASTVRQPPPELGLFALSQAPDSGGVPGDMVEVSIPGHGAAAQCIQMGEAARGMPTASGISLRVAARTRSTPAVLSVPGWRLSQSSASAVVDPPLSGSSGEG